VGADSKTAAKETSKKMGFKEKLSGVKAAMTEIEKQFGRGAIMLLGDDGGHRFTEPDAVISSGSVGVDRALGVGGLPKGRIVEVYGPEASGKTTVALHAIANVQRTGGVAAFIDAEHALDPRYAQALGIDLEQLLVSQPDHGEQALEIVETLIRSNTVDLIVVDSVAALVPKAEIEGEMGDAHVGLQARLMSQAMRKLTGHAARSKATILFINQTRHKIGVMFGSPETTTGGNALKFYASVRLDIRRIGALKNSDQIVGNRVRVKVVKNKVAPPFREAEFDVLYGQGISVAGELIDLGVEKNLIEKSGAWYAIQKEKMGQGKEKAREWLQARPVLMTRLREAVLSEEPVDLGAPATWGAETVEVAAAPVKAKAADKAAPAAA
jgi:recombination protein RecA